MSYNNKNWIRPIAEFHKTSTFKQIAPMLLFIASYTSIIVYLVLHGLDLDDLTGVSNLAVKDVISNITVMHSMLGFALSLLLVFRTNSAYDRWWEGRKLWGGLINSCRSLAIKLNVMIPKDDAAKRNYAREILGLFPVELHIHLQKEYLEESYQKPVPQFIPHLNRNHHVPAQYSNALMNEVQRWYKEQMISGEQLITINQEITSLLDIAGACERIKNTPIPYSYSSFIKKFIIIYSITLPFGFAFSLGWLTIPIVMFIFYVLTSLELIAEEIEEPFGIDPNDLPIARLGVYIEGNVHEMLHTAEIKALID